MAKILGVVSDVPPRFLIVATGIHSRRHVHDERGGAALLSLHKEGRWQKY